jgi:hypothetical protein
MRWVGCSPRTRWRSGGPPRESFRGRDAIVHVNRVYPEGWDLRVLDVQPLPDGRVLSLVRVDHTGATCYANSFFTLSADGRRIVRIEEFWSDVAEPPEWRRRSGLPGHARFEAPKGPA